jgi:hypothetical protein
MSGLVAVPAPAPGEPTPDALRNPIRRYLLATRPAFLTITLAGCLLGFALALVSLVGVLPALKAGQLLAAHAAEPARLVPAIRMTLLAAHLQPIILAGVLFWSGR